MAKYMQLVKYSPPAAAAIHKDGLVARRKVLDEYVKGLGGSIVDVYAIAESDWDFVAIMDFAEFPSAKLVAHGLLTYGSGAFERTQLFNLATFEEADEARKTLPGFRPPGT
jgi:uncharacterized protein with GYD domain